MTKLNAYIVEKAKAFVLKILSDELPEECVFHSPEHTLDVYNYALVVGRESGFSENELNCLGVSALFHDIGYTVSHDEHEIISVAKATEFLSSMDVNKDDIEQVKRAILATKVPQKPEDRVSEALCDADLLHLALNDYFERMEKLRLEWKLSGRLDLTEQEFHENSIKFFGQHHYHTKYGRQILAPKKDITLSRIIEKVKK